MCVRRRRRYLNKNRKESEDILNEIAVMFVSPTFFCSYELAKNYFVLDTPQIALEILNIVRPPPTQKIPLNPFSLS